jgi:hypothetical protein
LKGKRSHSFQLLHLLFSVESLFFYHKILFCCPDHNYHGVCGGLLSHQRKAEV